MPQTIPFSPDHKLIQQYANNHERLGGTAINAARPQAIGNARNIETADRGKLFNYFVKKKLNNLMQNIGDF